MNQTVINATVSGIRTKLAEVDKLLGSLTADVPSAIETPAVEPHRPEPEPFTWRYCGHGFGFEEMGFDADDEPILFIASLATYLSDNQGIHQTDPDRIRVIWGNAIGGLTTLLNLEEAVVPQLKDEQAARAAGRTPDTTWFEYHRTALRRWTEATDADVVACYRLAEFGLFFDLAGADHLAAPRFYAERFRNGDLYTPIDMDNRILWPILNRLPLDGWDDIYPVLSPYVRGRGSDEELASDEVNRAIAEAMAACPQVRGAFVWGHHWPGDMDATLRDYIYKMDRWIREARK